MKGVGSPRHDLEEWLEDWYTEAYRVACLILRDPSDAEEAVQDAYLRAWRSRDRIRNTSDVRPFLYRVVVNACRTQQRRLIGLRARRDPFDALDELASTDAATPSAATAAAEVAQLVRAALHELPERYRVAVVLRYFADLTEREVAEALGRPVGTVKSQLNEARRRLGTDPRLVGLMVEPGGSER